MQILEAAENYLEAVLILRQTETPVRSVAVARQLGYARPTVSIMLRRLRDDGYLEIGESGAVTLTEAGESVASRIYERHELMAKVLMALGVGRETAYADACKIEHDLSEESFERIKAHYLRTAED